MKAGYASPIRTPRGRDVMAACGQLRSLSVKLKKYDRKPLNSLDIFNENV